MTFLSRVLYTYHTCLYLAGGVYISHPRITVPYTYHAYLYTAGGYVYVFTNSKSRGAAIFNDGGVMDFNGGSLFDNNFADGSGDGGSGGGIYNTDGGVIT